MSANETQQSEAEKLRAAAREAATGTDVRTAVRDITVSALSEGRLDSPRIREVVDAVLSGVGQAVEGRGLGARQVLEDAWKGVDEALSKSAEAVRLSLLEARTDLSSFAESDLRRALSDLRDLDKLFLDTAAEVARGAGNTAKQIIEQLVQHAVRAGTDAGRTAGGAADALQHLLEDAANRGVKLGVNVTRQVAQLASGVLAGLADALDSASRPRDKS
jgi:hypothetical protein